MRPHMHTCAQMHTCIRFGYLSGRVFVDAVTGSEKCPAFLQENACRALGETSGVAALGLGFRVLGLGFKV